MQNKKNNTGKGPGRPSVEGTRKNIIIPEEPLEILKENYNGSTSEVVREALTDFSKILGGEYLSNVILSDVKGLEDLLFSKTGF